MAYEFIKNGLSRPITPRSSEIVNERGSLGPPLPLTRTVAWAKEPASRKDGKEVRP